MPPLPIFDDVPFDGVIMDRIEQQSNKTFLHPNHAKFIHSQLINIFFPQLTCPCALEGAIFNHLTCHLPSDVTPGFSTMCN